jgi:DNA uptake protein ComE-like DNA-binding protein
MALQSEQKALMFLGAIAVLGAGVRVVRAGRPAATATQPALEQQARAADSARHAPAGKRRKQVSPTREPVQQASAATVPRSRLDLDVATAVQIDSLPGMSPTLSKRIVADRIVNGPFSRIQGLRRVKGVSPKLVQRIDTLVTFSGTIPSANATDTVIPRSTRPAGRRKPGRQRAP